MSRAKAVLAARINDGAGKFPFVNVEIRRNASGYPSGRRKSLRAEAILGYYARYPHVVGNCLFPGCTGKVAATRISRKDHTEAFTKYQRIERDFSRVREGKAAGRGSKAPTKGRSIEETIGEFEEDIKNKQRKFSHNRSYTKSLEQFQTFCASANVRTVIRSTRMSSCGLLDGWRRTWRHGRVVTRITPTAIS